jgi:hypothetical protein
MATNVEVTMPTPGISLVGFLDQDTAINYLLNECNPVSEDKAVLIEEWQAAKAKLGATAVANYGHPDIRPIPAEQQSYIQKVRARSVFQREWRDTAIVLIEIDLLLAHQVSIDLIRAERSCGMLSSSPSVDELFAICLPLSAPNEQLKVVHGENSLLLKSTNLNMRIHRGINNPPFMGIQFGLSTPFVHVARNAGRCYLCDGYHRAYRLRELGVSHIPCVLREGKIDIGNKIPSFPAALLESSNPPTLAHFTRQRAHPVSLRVHSRVLSVMWAEYTVPDE